MTATEFDGDFEVHLGIHWEFDPSVCERIVFADVAGTAFERAGSWEGDVSGQKDAVDDVGGLLVGRHGWLFLIMTVKWRENAMVITD